MSLASCSRNWAVREVVEMGRGTDPGDGLETEDEDKDEDKDEDAVVELLDTTLFSFGRCGVSDGPTLAGAEAGPIMSTTAS